MAAPEGYTKLGNIGYADKGVYSADATYNKYNVVYHEGSTYVALKDNLHGVTPANGENWRYMAKGFNEASADGITVIDTSGIIDGTKKKKTILQTFLDKVGDFIINKAVTNEALLLKLADYVKKTDIVQTESTATNKVPSSAYLKQVKADINSNLGNISADLNTVIGDVNPLKSNYINHINTNVLNKVNLVLWDVNTADTPFKTGNTVYGNGFCITYSSGEQWLCQLAMAVGDSHLFTRHCREGVWSGWTTIGSSIS